MSDASVTIKDDRAEIAVPADMKITVSVRTNSGYHQHVTVTDEHNTTKYVFEGSRTDQPLVLLGTGDFTGTSKLVATFGGDAVPSRISRFDSAADDSATGLSIVAEFEGGRGNNVTFLELDWQDPKK